jgi:hypothetical protein
MATARRTWLQFWLARKLKGVLVRDQPKNCVWSLVGNGNSCEELLVVHETAGEGTHSATPVSDVREDCLQDTHIIDMLPGVTWEL